MQPTKTIGFLLIAGAVGVFIPYTILTMIFEYPDILRQDTGIILTKFHKGGSTLIFTWWAFAILGLPLLVAYVLIGQQLNGRSGPVKWVTAIGVISIVVQLVGLLRWAFVVPVLANNYVASSSDIIKQSSVVSFQTIHQFGGVLLGEHIGQLFTVIWTIMISYTLLKLNFFPKWISWFGIIASFIYFLAQAELFNTVIPSFPVWDMAGFIGSTLWLVWLIILGIFFIKKRS